MPRFNEKIEPQCQVVLDRLTTRFVGQGWWINAFKEFGVLFEYASFLALIVILLQVTCTIHFLKYQYIFLARFLVWSNQNEQEQKRVKKSKTSFTDWFRIERGDYVRTHDCLEFVFELLKQCASVHIVHAVVLKQNLFNIFNIKIELRNERDSN